MQGHIHSGSKVFSITHPACPSEAIPMVSKGSPACVPCGDLSEVPTNESVVVSVYSRPVTLISSPAPMTRKKSILETRCPMKCSIF
jgi:hypothetical protein